ncbi:MAG: response regulator [Acidobacteria bacterium]|nr:response regulator [Acidobacteriota bacterium]
MERIDLDIWSAKEVARLLTLVENEKRYYQEIIALLPVPLAVAARDSSIVSVNRAFRKAFDLRLEEVIHKRLEDLFGEAISREKLLWVLESREAEQGLPFLRQQPDGQKKAMRVSILPLYDWSQESATEALIVVEEATAAASPVAQLLEGLEAGLWKLDVATGAVEFATPYPAKLLGPEGASKWMERVTEEDAARVAWVYEAVLESGAPATVDYRTRRVDGAVVWLSDRIQPVVGTDRKVSALRVITTEESGRKERQEQAGMMRRMEALGRLAGKLSHDLNNLLMIVNGYGEELLERLPAADERRAGLQEILKASDRATALVQQLLQFSRPPAPHNQVFDLNEFLRRLQPAGTLDLSARPEPVSADPQQLETAVRELAALAAETLPRKESLRLETGRRTLISDYGEGALRGQFVSLRIGPVEGIGEDRLRQWCEPFAGGKAKETGFAGVYAALGQMGARVDLVREQGERGSFVILFPLAAMQEAAKPAAPAAAVEEAAARLETVLVVDDEESIRALVARILTRQGYHVLEASSSEEALRVAEACQSGIHLIVSDVMLPQLRGPELVRRLQQRRPELRALYISGYTDDPMLGSAALRAGEGFLQKPFTLAALVSTVRAVLDAPQN